MAMAMDPCFGHILSYVKEICLDSCRSVTFPWDGILSIENPKSQREADALHSLLFHPDRREDLFVQL